ncbi:E3 ubiquitin-protein ligase HOS1-like, partial [Trifolium medium]|nr:E3 ubiquitin-protein ligase HOS1-like [Trifolium medium]
GATDATADCTATYFHALLLPMSNPSFGCKWNFSLNSHYACLAEETLEHLAAIDLIELCKEAKVERCRATRDLRSCESQFLRVVLNCVTDFIMSAWKLALFPKGVMRDFKK